MEPIYLPRFKDVRGRRIAYASSALVVAAIVFGFVHEVELKQDVQCEIVSPAEVKILGQSGLVSAVYVHPQSRVSAGAPLFRVDQNLSLASDGRPRPLFDQQSRDEQLRTTAAQFTQRAAELNAQLDTSRQTEANRQGELAALDDQVSQGRQIVDTAASKLERLAAAPDYVVAERIEQARADWLQSKVAVAQALARREQLLAELGMLRGKRNEINAQLKELEANQTRALQDIGTRFEQMRQNAVISAPQAGVVTFSNLVAGRMLQPGDVALVIATSDGGPLRAALRIASRRRGFVQVGQTVRLKFDAFPYTRFGTYEARIDSVSGTTVATPAAGADADPQKPQGDYMAWATLRGNTFDVERQHFEILPGMRATASIVVERRTIAEWVLAPFFRMLRG
jgi:membrane fusion protein